MSREVLNPCPKCGKRFDFPLTGCMTFVDEFLMASTGGKCPECGTQVVLDRPVEFRRRQVNMLLAAKSPAEAEAVQLVDLDLPVRCRLLLMRMGIETFGDLVQHAKETFLSPRLESGISCLEEVLKLLEGRGCLASLNGRILKSVLFNFLGTYTSRYSDYGGYWLFGMIVGSLNSLTVDLLDAQDNLAAPEPFATAAQLAIRRFREQIDAARLSKCIVRQASLTIQRGKAHQMQMHYGGTCAGFDVSFRATAQTIRDKSYHCEQTLFVAPYNPQQKRQCWQYKEV